jgi:hypothetical protein
MALEHIHPGHWDAIAAEDFITKNFSEVRWAKYGIAEYGTDGCGDCLLGCKDVLFQPRPTT